MKKDMIKILYQTEKEAVVYKPSGIATQLSNDVKGSSLESILKIQLKKNKIFFPHRLDRVTSGLILIAFDKDTVNFYNEEIKSNKFEKYYLCRVEESDNKILNDPKLIGTHKRYIKYDGKKSEVVRSGGKTSFLDILAVEKAPGNTDHYHVLIRLITGRKHQIRVMLSDIGIPLCGDHLYNPHSRSKKFYLESIYLGFNDTENEIREFYIKDKSERDDLSSEMNSKIEKVLN